MFHTTSRILLVCSLSYIAACANQSVQNSDTNADAIVEKSNENLLASTSETSGVDSVDVPESHRFSHPDRQLSNEIGRVSVANSGQATNKPLSKASVEPATAPKTTAPVVVSAPKAAKPSPKAPALKAAAAVAPKLKATRKAKVATPTTVEVINQLPSTAAGIDQGMRLESPDKKALQAELDRDINYSSEVRFAEQCTISTPSRQVDGREFSSQVWFSFEDGKLMLHSTAKIRSGSGQSALILDNESVPFAPSGSLQSALWAGDISELSLDRNPQLSLYSSDLGRTVVEELVDIDALLKARNKYISLCSLQGN